MKPDRTLATVIGIAAGANRKAALRAAAREVIDQTNAGEVVLLSPELSAELKAQTEAE